MIPAIRILREPSTSAARAPSRIVKSRNALVHALKGSSGDQAWILESEGSVGDLLRAMAEVPPKIRPAKLISYLRPQSAAAQVIEAGFVRALWGAHVMVKLDDLSEILANEHPEDFCVGAEWDPGTQTIALWRGDLSVVVVPLSALPPRGHVQPEPLHLAIEDCGQTIRLGAYEASFSALLYERDPLYRRRAKKRMIREEQSLGASIRRLRLARGLARTDFNDPDPRTLARIERGEVQRPQRATLERIAKRLGVSVEELAEY